MMFAYKLICDVLRSVGRLNLADDIDYYCERHGEVSEESLRMGKALLVILRSVMGELCNYHFPFSYKAEFSTENGCVDVHEGFNGPLSRITRVVDADTGKDIQYIVTPQQIIFDAKKVIIYYDYADKDEYDFSTQIYVDTCDYDFSVIRCGLLAEYFLMIGDTENYEIWDKKYMRCIKQGKRLKGLHNGSVPARRWM